MSFHDKRLRPLALALTCASPSLAARTRIVALAADDVFYGTQPIGFS